MTQRLKHFIYALYILVVVCIGLATVIEKYHGTDYVGTEIYGSWWFALMWALLTAAAVAYMCRQRLFRRPAVFLLHLSFVVILIGALTTHLTAERDTVHLRKGDGGEVRLLDFHIEYYPGTNAPLDYQSIVVAHGDTMTISMNRVGESRGYRYFQSSYDSDGEGTTLGVYYDPWGIGITYFGYSLLLIGIIWSMASRHTLIRSLYRQATDGIASHGRQTVIFLFALLTFHFSPASAQQTVSPRVARSMSTVMVLYNNRVCPLNTVATDFVTKLSGKASWEGHSADEVFCSWMFYATSWEKAPLIRIKSTYVQQLLGIPTEWASFSDFWDMYNEYKLEKPLKEANQRGDAAALKALREADEKFNVVRMLYSTELLHFFPYQSKGEPMHWYGPVSTRLPKDIPAEEHYFIVRILDYLGEAVIMQDEPRALEMISKIKLYQREKAGTVMPSQAVVKAEVFYNALNAQRWVVFMSLTLALCFSICLLGGWQFARRRWFTIACITFVVLLLCLLTTLLVLRWGISGHVPVSNGYETMQFMAWAMLVLTLVMMRKFPIVLALGPLVTGFCMLVAMLAGGNPQITPLMPVLQSPLLSVHVMVVMVAYALFALLLLLGLRGLWLSRKGVDSLAHDELYKLTALSRLLLYPAVFLLTIGIFIGAVWANVSWGSYWSWDPKETWALITMMVYAVPLHAISIPAMQRPRTYHLFMVLAFLSVLITYFGVNYILGGMHSYA
jgi:cytochrome c-type biogenesis protein CcsB